jgi:VanZ family protein
LGLNISFLRGKEFWWYWLPPLSWCTVIVVISGDLGSAQHTLVILKWLLSWLTLEPKEFNEVHYLVRKTIGHFGNYAFLFFLWFRAFRSNQNHRPGRVYLWSLVLCLILALLDEGHQAMFSSRGSSLKDVALDMSGATVAALITRFVRTPRFRRPAK